MSAAPSGEASSPSTGLPPIPGTYGGGLARRPVFVALLLAGLALAVYSQVVGHEFLGYDDRFFVVENKAVRAGLHLSTLRWAFFSTSGFWFPLTRLSHLLD